MSIIISVSQAMSEDPRGQRVAEVNGRTVAECLNELVQKQPNLKRSIFDGNGNLNEYVDIFINRETAFPKPLEKKVKDGDELQIISIIGGG